MKQYLCHEWLNILTYRQLFCFNYDCVKSEQEDLILRNDFLETIHTLGKYWRVWIYVLRNVWIPLPCSIRPQECFHDHIFITYCNIAGLIPMDGSPGHRNRMASPKKEKPQITPRDGKILADMKKKGIKFLPWHVKWLKGLRQIHYTGSGNRLTYELR